MVKLSQNALTAPFGIHNYAERKSLALCIETDENEELCHFLKTLDEKIYEFACEERETVFRNPPPMEMMRDLHKTLLRKGKPGYCDTIQLKCDANTEFYDSVTQKKIDISSVNKGCQIIPIISFGRVWFMNNAEFGLSIKLRYALVAPPKKEDVQQLFADCSFTG